jgi:hypothetical protein
VREGHAIPSMVVLSLGPACNASRGQQPTCAPPGDPEHVASTATLFTTSTQGSGSEAVEMVHEDWLTHACQGNTGHGAKLPMVGISGGSSTQGGRSSTHDVCDLKTGGSAPRIAPQAMITAT